MAKTDNMPHKRVNTQEYENKGPEFPNLPPTTLSPDDLARIFTDRSGPGLPTRNQGWEERNHPQPDLPPVTAARPYNGPELPPTININQLNEQFDMGMPTTYRHSQFPSLPDTKLGAPGAPDTYLDITLENIKFGGEDKEEEFSQGMEM
ncbi:MAG: hypothetical protein IJ419_08260 [Agathobacter sp.]|nr:hypothetical protein [Agathobacter sp.]